jgi:Phosphotransferase enzyme family
VGAPDPLLPPAELHQVFGSSLDGELTVERVYEPVASASAGIWRVRRDDRSAILKVIAHAEGGHENWRSGEEPAHWYYWRREVLAYETGLLESLPGKLRAPTCLLVAPRTDGSVALWLEDLRGIPATDWQLERYEMAARHLGQTQGAYVTRRDVPVDEWLSRNWLREYLSQRDGDLHLVGEADAWDHPLVSSWFPDPPVDRLQEMRRGQAQFLDALDRLPRTLCHLDLHPRNLFADGEHETVAIDWAFAGIGAIGEDAGNLVPDSVLDFHLDPGQLEALYALVAGGYHAGLRDAGWDGPLSTVRLAMAATIAAKYAWIAPAMLRVTAEGRETLNGRPVADALRWWAPTVTFLLDRADEARDLIPS